MLVPASQELIIAATTHPRNWRYAGEHDQDPASYKPIEGHIHLAHGDQGVLTLHRVFSPNVWMAHIVMLPGAKGVLEFSRETLDKFALLMGVRKYLALNPVDARAARLLAKKLGFVEEARITKTVKRSEDKMVDVIILGKNL